MLNLFVAALFLFGSHLGVASTSMRHELIGRVGEGVYRGIYSVLAVVAFLWLVTLGVRHRSSRCGPREAAYAIWSWR